MQDSKSKTLIAYYSKTGNNQYLAAKLASELAVDHEEIKPKWGGFFIQVMATIMGTSTGIKTLQQNPLDYDHVILCGPIWMGNLISPLLGFVRKYKSGLKSCTFITCCGSSDEKKDDTFGYNRLFKKIGLKFPSINWQFHALSILLVLDKEDRKNDELIRKAQLNDQTFKDEFKERFDSVVDSVSVKSKSLVSASID